MKEFRMYNGNTIKIGEEIRFADLWQSETGVKGVSYNRKMQKYVAYIGFQGKNKILGYFKTLEEAATARKQAEEELYKPILEKYDYKSNKKLT